MLITTYTALSLLLLIVGEHLPAAALRGAGAFLFAPLDRVVLSGDRIFVSWRENQSLHARIASLELDNQRLRTSSEENRALRAQLGLPEWKGLALRPVEVLALGGDPSPTSATLSAGAHEGIKVGDAVLTSDGLVGRVVEVYGHLARAALLTDPNLAVACEVESTGVNGILRYTPTPTPRLLLTAVPLADTMKVGQIVVTSDLSLRFPRGVPVGRVVHIDRDATGLMQEVEVRPAARLTRLRHAFLTPGPVIPEDVLPRPHMEFEPHRIAPPPGVKAKVKPAPAHADTTARHAAAVAPADSGRAR